MHACKSARMVFGLFALFLLAPPAITAQGQSTIMGRVTAAGSRAPVESASVSIAGSQTTTSTGRDGRFSLGGFPAGAVDLVVTRSGYQPTRLMTVTRANATVTLDVQLHPEVPTVTSELNVAAHIAEVPASNLSQLLAGRFAGVQVTSSGATGTGSRVRIRGQSSLVLGNDPLIVVDGVRLFPLSSPDNRSVPSRLDDINPEEIDNIEILSGPSATTLYGTRASNGVVNITTKRGLAGKLRINAYTENGLINDRKNYPDLYSLWGKRTGSSASSLCTLALVSTGACTVDSLSHGNVLKIDSLTPIDVGYRSQYGAQLSGGSRRIQFFVSGEREDETGVYKMPARDIARLELERGVSSLPDRQTRPSALSRNSVRANISLQPAEWLSVHLSNGYVNGDTRLVVNEDNAFGLGYDATGGAWRQDLKDTRGVPLLGYAFAAPGDVVSQSVSQGIDRFVNSASANLKPVNWLTFNGAFGIDDTRQRDDELTLAGQGVQEPRNGSIGQLRMHSTQKTIDAGATATYSYSWLGTKTSVGVQAIRANSATKNEAVGSSSETSGTSRTTGYYAEETLAFAERLFVSGGVRRDDISVLGTDWKATTYPTIGVSWLLSEHAFAKRDWLNTLRLRAAYGTAGRISGNGGGTQFVVFIPASSTPVTGAALQLRPELSKEGEAGIDLAVFNSASTLAFTYYDKRTTEAFIPTPVVPPLSGTGFTQNGSAIQNRGVELAYSQRLVNQRQFAANVSLIASTNRNRVTAFPDGVLPVFTGNRSTERNVQGYPLFGLWGRTYTYADANHDGILTLNELQFSDTAQFIGSSFPTRALTITPNVELLNHRLRLSAQIDSKWGFRKFNNTLRYQCQTALSCRGLNDRNASLEVQAAAVAAQQGMLAGMFEDGSFTRLREASLSYELPLRWASALRASALNIALTARNLGVSTNYSGADPESFVSNTDARQDEHFSTPPMRYFTLRLNLKY